MLLELRVRDFGIIEDMNWNLSSGLNVITGETGVGKSLVIDPEAPPSSFKVDATKNAVTLPPSISPVIDPYAEYEIEVR